MSSRSLSKSKSSELFPSYGMQWKEYDDLSNLGSTCNLKTWEHMWYSEKERDFYHYGANTNVPRIYSSENDRIAENPNVGDDFDATIFIFLIVMVIVPYIYAICTRRKHFFISQDIPIISYHYRVGKTKARRLVTKHSDIIADLQNRGLENNDPSRDSICSAAGGENIDTKTHPHIIKKGSVFMAGGIVLTSEKYTKTYEDIEPSCICGPCYKWKKIREKTSTKISKNKVAPEDFVDSSRDPASSAVTSSSKLSN